LLLQGKQRGLIGHGVVTSEPWPDKHFDGSGRTTNFVDVSFDALLPLSARIQPEVLTDEVPDVAWRYIFSSGTTITPSAEADVWDLWAGHVGVPGIAVPGELPPGVYPEGAVRTVMVNRYERDPRARRDCLDHYGSDCFACGQNLTDVYGDLGMNLIHVHHIVPLSTVEPGYAVDPVKDLRPLCPNCHAAVHKENPPLNPSDLRDQLGGA
jgi:5-methylcytosine-specific restriction protein A